MDSAEEALLGHSQAPQTITTKSPYDRFARLVAEALLGMPMPMSTTIRSVALILTAEVGFGSYGTKFVGMYGARILMFKRRNNADVSFFTTQGNWQHVDFSHLSRDDLWEAYMASSSRCFASKASVIARCFPCSKKLISLTVSGKASPHITSSHASRFFRFCFTSPDEFKGGPEELFGEVDPHDPLFYAEIAEPQSLNKYHYALNNPLRYIDPDGHQTTTADKILQGVKAVVRAGVDSQIGVDKAGANILIGASNIGAGATGQPMTEPLRPEGKVQTVSMIVADRVFLFGSLLGGKPNVGGVAVADTKATTVVAGEAANAGAASAEAREVDAVAGSSNAARREAMREQGIPTSQQPR
jgi:hypothetical protein